MEVEPDSCSGWGMLVDGMFDLEFSRDCMAYFEANWFVV